MPLFDHRRRSLATSLLAIATVILLVVGVAFTPSCRTCVVVAATAAATTHGASSTDSPALDVAALTTTLASESAVECDVTLPTDDAFMHDGPGPGPDPDPDPDPDPSPSDSPLLSPSVDSQSSTPTPPPPPPRLAILTVRPSHARGHANHVWLHTYHTFSFASYDDSAFDRFHSLRVLNEDRVAGGAGFGMHPHTNFEIFSYIVSGALRHDDSLGHREVLPRGSVQFTSAGSGLSHSEYNNSPSEVVHFLQVWLIPEVRDTPPQYATKHFTDNEKTNQLRLILSRTGVNDSIAIVHQDVNVYACLLEPGVALTFDLTIGRDAYVHVIQDAVGFVSEANRVAIEVNGVTLRGGDGAFVRHDRSASKSVGGRGGGGGRRRGGEGGGSSSSSRNSRNTGSRLNFRGVSSDQRATEFLLFDIRQTDARTAWR